MSTTAPASPNPLMATYPPPPVTFVRGEGCHLWDADGRRYLDMLSGLAVTSLGHAHPAVADALATQARTLLHVSNLFGTVPGPEVARTLDRLIGDGEPVGGQVFFCNSGAEANECAIKLARRFGGRGRHVVVSAYGSFHGRTLATLHATGQPAKHEPFQPLPEGFRHVEWQDLDALANALDPSVAAVLLEPVQGEGGVNPATAEYFAGVRRLCDERGALFMVDEVQTGLGRTGRWFGFQHLDIRPDVVTMAKALGNGVPIGACWARGEVAVGVRAGRPRHHLRRPAARHRRGPRRAGHDGGRGRARPGHPRRRPPDRAPRGPPRRGRPSGDRACCSASSSTATTPGRSTPPCSTRAWWPTR